MPDGDPIAAGNGSAIGPPMSGRSGELDHDSLDEQLAAAIPELRDEIGVHARDWDEEGVKAQYLLFVVVFEPRLLALVREGRDSVALVRYLDFVERMAVSRDKRVQSILHTVVMEGLVGSCSPRELSLARSHMGPESIRALEAVAKSPLFRRPSAGSTLAMPTDRAVLQALASGSLRALTVEPILRRNSRAARVSAWLAIPTALVLVGLNRLVVDSDGLNPVVADVIAAALIVAAAAPFVLAILATYLGPVPGLGWFFEDAGARLLFLRNEFVLVRNEKPAWRIGYREVADIVPFADSGIALRRSNQEDLITLPRVLTIGRVVETGRIIAVDDLLADLIALSSPG